MPSTVKGRNDDHLIVRNGVDQPIRKPPQRSPARVTIYDWVLKRVVCDSGRSTLEGANELGTKTSFLGVVPVGTGRQFDAGGRSDDQPTSHLRRDQSHSRTSS